MGSAHYHYLAAMPRGIATRHAAKNNVHLHELVNELKLLLILLLVPEAGHAGRAAHRAHRRDP